MLNTPQRPADAFQEYLNELNDLNPQPLFFSDAGSANMRFRVFGLSGPHLYVPQYNIRIMRRAKKEYSVQRQSNSEFFQIEYIC
jgi:hypothetical protein